LVLFKRLGWLDVSALALITHFHLYCITYSFTLLTFDKRLSYTRQFYAYCEVSQESTSKAHVLATVCSVLL